jgi:transposase
LIPVLPNNDEPVEVAGMLALDPRVVEAAWAAFEPLLPPLRPDTHPLGCHRPRISDRDCFEAILIRLVTGCSWDVAGRLGKGGETTLRRRRDAWVAAGVFSLLVEQALAGYDRIVGLDLSETALDASQHKAPCGGGTGPNCTDKGRQGWKWSLLTDRVGIPIGWGAAPANRHDAKLVAATLDDAADRGLLGEIETLHLDRGYAFNFVREDCAQRGLFDVQIPAVRKRRARRRAKKIIPLGLRWPVERTNSWLTNFGQLRRSTDRRTEHRTAQLELAISLILIVKLVKWANRWNR